MTNIVNSFRCVLLLALFSLCVSGLKADVILSYKFKGLPGDQYSTPSVIGNKNISATDLVLGSGLYPLGTANSMSATGFAMGKDLDVKKSDYWEFSITPAVNYAVMIDSINFSYIRSTNGPQNLAIRSSLDGYAKDLAPAKTAIMGGVGESLSFDLSKMGYIDGPVTFRLYGYGSTTEGGSGGFRSAEPFAVNGSVRVAASK